MRTPGSCTETPLRPSQSIEPPLTPLHINDEGTQRMDNYEFDREIAGDKSPKHQSEVVTYDHRGKKMIFPEGKGFVPAQVASRAITTIIKRKYKDGIISYQNIKKKEELHREWFDAFKGEVGWLPQYEDTVMKIFDRKCSHHLSDMLRNVRISTRRPYWIDEMSWASLQEYWSSDKFLKISHKYKRNRAFGKEGLLHTSGSILTFEHARLTGGKDHEGTQMKKLRQEKNNDSLYSNLYGAPGRNVEEMSVYIVPNDSEANEQKPNQQNDHLFVPPGFEQIARGTQKPQRNQQVQKPDQQNDHPPVPSGFENIARGTQEPQRNQQVQKPNQQNDHPPVPPVFKNFARGTQEPQRNQQVQKPNQQNDHPPVPLEFENIARGTHEPQRNQHVQNSNSIKVGHMVPAMIEEEFQGGFWIHIKDGDSSLPPLRGIIFKPLASNQNNKSPSTGFGNSGAMA